MNQISKSNIKQIIYVPFTGLGIIDFRGDSWFQYRADIFRDYTLKSLACQDEKDFTLWVSFRQEEKENPITKQIEQDIKNTGLNYVLTFDGIMMHDDRGVWHNKNLRERMDKSLAEVREVVGESEWIYQTDLGSDDLLHKDALKEIKEQEPKVRGATYYFNGYVLDIPTNRLADWLRETSCSKYTVMFPYEDYFNVEKHLEYTKELLSHEYIPKIFNAVRLPDGRYMAGVHRGNISSGWDNKFRGKQYNDIDKQIILKNFGL